MEEVAELTLLMLDHHVVAGEVGDAVRLNSSVQIKTRRVEVGQTILNRCHHARGRRIDRRSVRIKARHVGEMKIVVSVLRRIGHRAQVAVRPNQDKVQRITAEVGCKLSLCKVWHRSPYKAVDAPHKHRQVAR